MAHYIIKSQYYGTVAIILMCHEIIFSLLKKKILQVTLLKTLAKKGGKSGIRALR